MTITNGYLTQAEAMSFIGQSEVRDSDELDDVVTAVSRQIDEYCQRHFYTVTEARTFEVEDLRELHFGAWNDLTTLTTLKTDAGGDGTYETTITSTNYQLEPFNASLRGRPWLEVCLLNGLQFPTPVYDAREDLIQITGVWGWPAVPPAVKQACRIQVSRIAKRSESPLGVAGFGEFGVIRLQSRLDPDVQQMIEPFRHPDGYGLA